MVVVVNKTRRRKLVADPDLTSYVDLGFGLGDGSFWDGSLYVIIAFVAFLAGVIVGGMTL